MRQQGQEFVNCPTCGSKKKIKSNPGSAQVGQAKSGPPPVPGAAKEEASPVVPVESDDSIGAGVTIEPEISVDDDATNKPELSFDPDSFLKPTAPAEPDSLDEPEVLEEPEVLDEPTPVAEEVAPEEKPSIEISEAAEATEVTEEKPESSDSPFPGIVVGGGGEKSSTSHKPSSRSPQKSRSRSRSHQRDEDEHAPAKAGNSMPLIIGAVVAGIALLGVGVGAAIYLGGDSDDAKETAKDTDKKEEKKDQPTGMQPTETTAVVHINWPDSQRNGAQMRLNDASRPIDIRPGIPVEFRLAPGKYRIELMREGAVPITYNLDLAAGQLEKLAPNWATGVADTGPTDTDEPEDFPIIVPGGPDDETDAPTFDLSAFTFWERDLQAAKSDAAERGRNILIIIDDTSLPENQRTAIDQVFAEPPLLRDIFEEYTAVYADCSDAEYGSNARQMKKQFQVTRVPSIVLTDARGSAYAIVNGNSGGDADVWMSRFNDMLENRQRLIEAIGQIKQRSDPRDAMEALNEARQLAEVSGISKLYAAQFDKRQVDLQRQIDALAKTDDDGEFGYDESGGLDDGSTTEPMDPTDTTEPGDTDGAQPTDPVDPPTDPVDPPTDPGDEVAKIDIDVSDP